MRREKSSIVMTLCLLALLFVLSSTVGAISYDEMNAKIVANELEALQSEVPALMYLDAPSEVFENDVFSITLLVNVNTVEAGIDNVDITLVDEAGNDIPLYTIGSPNPDAEEDFTLYEWRLTEERNTLSYVLSINADERSHEEQLTVIVKPKVVADTFTISDVVENVEPQGFAIQEVRDELLEEGMVFTPEEFEVYQDNAKEVVVLEKKKITTTTTYEDDTTKTTTTVQLLLREIGDAESVTVIEIIPKEFAERANEMEYSPQPTTILQDDPMIMWHIEELEDTKTITYEIDTDTEVTGNTVLLIEQLPEKTKRRNTILAIVLVPLVAIIVIFFAQFSPGKKHTQGGKQKK